MIELGRDDLKKVNLLYDEVKEMILSKSDEVGYIYEKKFHSLYEDNATNEIRTRFYNESGRVEFQNAFGETVVLEIKRWHPHMHNGWSGLGSTPCLSAIISVKKNNKEQKLWELTARSGTLYYKAEITSFELPYNILQQDTEVVIEDKEQHERYDSGVGEFSKDVALSHGNKNLFEEIQKLVEKVAHAKQVSEDILLKRKTEIENETKRIMDSYAPLINQCNNDVTMAKKELHNFNKLFARYSTFNIDLIGNALQKLISIVEGEEFSYQQVSHNSCRVVHGTMDSWEENVKTKANIIVKNSKVKSCYNSTSQYDSEINILVNNGDALLLTEQDFDATDSKKITFYTAQNGQVCCNVNFGRFDYIKVFVDSIIQYRFMNNKNDFTESDMVLFMKNFLIDSKDIIVKNYESKIDEKVLMLSSVADN